MSNIVQFTPRSNRAARMDALTNRLTGYNTTERDHGQGYNWEIRGPRLNKSQRDDMYARHEIVWKIINLLPDNALRKWLAFPKLDEQQQRKLRKLIKDCNLKPALKHGFHMSALHGGASLYAPLFDGRSTDQPLNIASLTGIGRYEAFEIDYLYPDPDQVDRTMNPEHWIMVDTFGAVTRIHVSRLIILPGAECGGDWWATQGGRWPSKLERVIEPLVAYCAAHGIVPNILKDIIRDILKIAGLNNDEEEDSPEEQAAFNLWLDALMRAESLINKTLIDAEDDYIRQTTDTQGVPEMIRTTERRLTAAIGYPHTILLGESPGAALSQAGTSQKKDWNEATENFQADEVAPALDVFFALAEQVLKIDEIEYVFNPLDVPTAKEKAEVFDKVASAAEKLKRSKIATTLELGTLFEGDEVRTIPALDLKGREAKQADHAAMLDELFKAAPDPVFNDPNQSNGGPEEDGREQERETGEQEARGRGRGSDED